MPDVVFGTNEKWRINRNMFVLGFAFMIQFTAFHGTANLQSSVNSDDGAGTFTLAAIYFSLILSNIFLPAIVIKWLGCKWAVAFSFIAYMPFICAQFYPRLYTLVPAGMMVGFGGGPLWCAKCTYLSVATEPYSKLSGIPADVLVVRFFGLFFMFYQMAQIWGNLVSSAILSSSLGEVPSFVNETLVPALLNVTNVTAPAVDYGATCGVNFCSGSASHDNENLVPPSPLKIRVIAGVYLACMISACLLVAVGVDSLTRYASGRKLTAKGKSGMQLLAVTLRQLRHKYQLLLLPVIGYIGAEQAFMAADFTQAFVGCAYGINNIGFVMICFGVFNALAAPVGGSVVKLTGRYPVMVTALLLNLGLITALLLWRPSPDQWLIFFILAAVWGTADAVWLVQVNGSKLRITTLLLWRPSPDQWLIFFVLAAVWGTADAVWLIQVNVTALLLWRPSPDQWLVLFVLAAVWGTADAVWLVKSMVSSFILIFPASIITVLLLWRPSPDQWLIFFVLAAVWGTADAVWLFQVNVWGTADAVWLVQVNGKQFQQLLNLSLITALLLWRPSPDQWLIFFVLAAVWGTADAVWLVQVNDQWLIFFILAAVWGTADAVWLVQVNALSGILFPGDEEAAYSNFRLWEATGSVLAYATAPYLCVRTRLYILLGLLILGFTGYTTIELLEYKVKQAHQRERTFELIKKKEDDE
ncbi:ion channel regulatory protein UNC-93 domain-containing protein [Phthorimaea operculella]|nr:ion channel regulatory protein UNC-93 domain-containing protein [Phthorimaea operculella]